MPESVIKSFIDGSVKVVILAFHRLVIVGAINTRFLIDNYGILVHSCFVEDGQGEKQLIVDEKGSVGIKLCESRLSNNYVA